MTQTRDIPIGPGHFRRVALPPSMPVPIAPLGGFMGQLAPRPWQYDVTVCLPHLDTLPQLRLALDLWRCQTLRPYFLVLDTGSPRELLDELEAVRAPDCEVHYIRAHGYLHSSAPVTAALDLAHSLCRTEYLFHTHTDVFARRRDFLAWLRDQCRAEAPVVGWQMSSREMAASPFRGEWRECVSHTATMIHMPTAHRAGLTWAMEAYYAWRPEERGPSVGWPDTESPFLLALRRAGIVPVLLGEERNFTLTRNTWFEHARSYPGLKAHAQNDALWAKIQQYTTRAEEDARARLAVWRADSTPPAPAQ